MSLTVGVVRAAIGKRVMLIQRAPGRMRVGVIRSVDEHIDENPVADRYSVIMDVLRPGQPAGGETAEVFVSLDAIDSIEILPGSRA